MLNEKVKSQQVIEREDVENDIIFLGFMLFVNSVKKETAAVIEEIYADTDLEIKMITGDNIFTSIYVGLSSKMIP